MPRVAVVDDELTVCARLKRVLEKDGFEVEAFQSARSFLESFARDPFPIVFLDVMLPDANGIEVLAIIKKSQRDVEVIIITGHGSIDSAIEAIRRGAYHYVTKPFKLEEIRSLAGGAREKIGLREENRLLREALGGGGPLDGFIGNSGVMQEIFSMVRKVAVVNCNVLLQGESGTGKELVARSIHRLSPRKDGPFVSFNCGGFTEELICNELFGHEKGAFTGATITKIGLLESGAGGTVFLDEIGEMPSSMQVRLLRVIQERRILRVGGTRPVELDIRLIAASNRDIKKAASEGTFREDLFYRLNVVTLYLPRLAERKDDIPLLISYFIEKYSRPFGKKVKRISPQALDILLHYNFPGNIRELENIVQRAVALAEGEMIRTEDLPSDLQKLEFSSLDGEGLLSLEELEKQHIARVLEKTDHNKVLSSKILNLPRTTLWRKMRKYNLLKGD
ncbi:MAG: Fis family transcriptional regulator [Deltaproteobacteria bacterium CG23_combo_of_CG06-09_8_20_14_all_51_20]|nr:sigma-54-dependent Fis family transcriptional regulator [bacterium]OIP39639.1 MAG: Fis family transcriptional regulator [Desulfobacteraceae bacterium CG2_30_51_40]PIP46583.1 MAG: Fis family transcriptional regulator [Deltaproteobacteria bacterium CG23_combo_of_CG06-09_8_20_14_all_51_20]